MDILGKIFQKKMFYICQIVKIKSYVNTKTLDFNSTYKVKHNKKRGTSPRFLFRQHFKFITDN